MPTRPACLSVTVCFDGRAVLTNCAGAQILSIRTKDISLKLGLRPFSSREFIFERLRKRCLA